VLHELGIIALTESESPNVSEALKHLRQAVATYEELDSPRHAASSLFLIAQAHRCVDELELARAALRRSRDISDRIGNREAEWERERLLALIELDLQDPESAIESLIELSRLVPSTQDSLPRDYIQLLMKACDCMGEDRLREEWETKGGSRAALDYALGLFVRSQTDGRTKSNQQDRDPV